MVSLKKKEGSSHHSVMLWGQTVAAAVVKSMGDTWRNVTLCRMNPDEEMPPERDDMSESRITTDFSVSMFTVFFVVPRQSDLPRLITVSSAPVKALGGNISGSPTFLSVFFHLLSHTM